MLTNPDALALMKKEWSGLIDQGVFDLAQCENITLWPRRQKRKGKRYTWLAPGVCVEKHLQLPGDPRGSSRVGVLLETK